LFNANCGESREEDEKNAYVFGKFLGERYKNNAVM
jgi:hypothetical protein